MLSDMIGLYLAPVQVRCSLIYYWHKLLYLINNISFYGSLTFHSMNHIAAIRVLTGKPGERADRPGVGWLAVRVGGQPSRAAGGQAGDELVGRVGGWSG